ncbi:MAG: EamA family transporter [Rhodobacteraceae bacterium]|nr:MAG: EamA family transporter [Paracoccaceae bacterium]
MRARATAIGFLAVLSWALLALLTVASGATPPFQLAAMCFAVGGAIGVAAMLAGGRSPARAFAQPARIWALGVGGLFGYHFCYFTALRNAPAAEAGLIAYLWPLLIVLFSGLLPGERLRPLHLLGAGAAMAGAGLILAPALDGFDAAHRLGYAAAGACALIWSGYSVLSRRAGGAPTDTVAAFCLASALLAAVCHVALEETVWPAGWRQWAAVALLGLGPVGGAFYAWDVGVKRGDIQVLGVASYAAPLLSTLALIAAGVAKPAPSLVIAALLIAGGAALAALASRDVSAARPTSGRSLP